MLQKKTRQSSIGSRHPQATRVAGYGRSQGQSGRDKRPRESYLGDVTKGQACKQLVLGVWRLPAAVPIARFAQVLESQHGSPVKAF